ncbi:MAG TPA: tyrosine-type recombinase/integrase, partial [Candidatus Binataceae bacterium]|nr:tyrosine-type recombinase/integrase [Candidatus Binataceae bacterium]
WAGGVIGSGSITVPKSKTEAGTGRVIPLTQRACAVLTLWLLRFPDGDAQSYVFPHHAVGVAGSERVTYYHDVDLNRPAGEWKKAWNVALRRAGLRYRWHDLRHTFITRLLENPSVSEETIRALAGHVSKKMLERYSHIRTQAKQAAIAALEAGIAGSWDDGAQNRAQSDDPELLN